MRRSAYAFSLTANVTRTPIRALVVLTALVMGSPLAGAMPPASGSNCSGDWVNNEGALECFMQGEEEGNSGVSNPHYVACTADGEIFCCVNKNGGQVCESQAGAERATIEQKLGAILDAQRSLIETLSRISKRVDSLENKVPEPNHKD